MTAEYDDLVAHLLEARDRQREAARRPSVCCAPEVCPTCWDHGGHDRTPVGMTGEHVLGLS